MAKVTRCILYTLLLLVWFFVGFMSGKRYGTRAVEPTTVYEVVVDTVTEYLPVIQYERVVDTVYYSVVARAEGQEAVADADSVHIELPVIQRHYGDSIYEAWVSGPLDPRLDSIRIYERKTVEVRTATPTKRWHIGATAGYGFSARGFEPYIGIGITYSIFSF